MGALLPFGSVSASFITPEAINIDGIFSDWGTPDKPKAGVTCLRDSAVQGEQDSTGFSGLTSDIDYVWSAIQTQNGGTTSPGPSNPITGFLFRIDTDSVTPPTNGASQSYFIQLNLGIAGETTADHCLQLWTNKSNVPEVVAILYEYATPYPMIRGFTTLSMTSLVCNISDPYPG